MVAVARKNKDAVGAAALRLLVQMSCDKNMRNVLGKDALAKSLLEVSKERLRSVYFYSERHRMCSSDNVAYVPFVFYFHPICRCQ